MIEQKSMGLLQMNGQERRRRVGDKTENCLKKKERENRFRVERQQLRGLRHYCILKRGQKTLLLHCCIYFTIALVQVTWRKDPLVCGAEVRKSAAKTQTQVSQYEVTRSKTLHTTGLNEPRGLFPYWR